MRYPPNMNDESEAKEVSVLCAAPWQLKLLELNPEYNAWGNYEDSMTDDESHWRSRIFHNTWREFSATFGDPDQYNEVVNFYFNLYRKGHDCERCDGSGMSEAYKRLSDDWYDFDNTGRKWSNNITEVEILALVKSGRLWDLLPSRCFFDEESGKWFSWQDGVKVEGPQPEMPTPDVVNAWARKGIGHDAINYWICVAARAKHLGITETSCPHCIDGTVYDEDNATAGLQLWMLHPRKGCSRGIYIHKVEEADLPEVYGYLRLAAERNHNRFSKIPNHHGAKK